MADRCPDHDADSEEEVIRNLLEAGEGEGRRVGMMIRKWQSEGRQLTIEQAGEGLVPGITATPRCLERSVSHGYQDDNRTIEVGYYSLKEATKKCVENPSCIGFVTPTPDNTKSPVDAVLCTFKEFGSLEIMCSSFTCFSKYDFEGEWSTTNLLKNKNSGEEHLVFRVQATPSGLLGICITTSENGSQPSWSTAAVPAIGEKVFGVLEDDSLLFEFLPIGKNDILLRREDGTLSSLSRAYKPPLSRYSTREFRRTMSLETFGRRRQYEPYNTVNTVLFVIHPRCTFRVQLVKVIDHSWWDRGVLILIILNVIILVLDDKLFNGYDWVGDLVSVSEILFQLLFTVEAVIKILALGFFLHPGSYLRSYPAPFWNRLDFLIVVGGFAGNFTVLRLLRCLRPLRTMNRIGKLRRLMNTLLDAAPHALDISMLFFLLVWVFSILGIHLFGGDFHRRCYASPGWYHELGGKSFFNEQFCSDIRNLTENHPYVGLQNCGSDVPLGYDPLLIINDSQACGSGWECSTSRNGITIPQQCSVVLRQYEETVYTFDTVWNAFLLTFRLMTLDDWPDSMEVSQNVHGHHVWVFYFLCTFLGNIIAVNLTLAVLSKTYYQAKSLATRPRPEVPYLASSTLAGATLIHPVVIFCFPFFIEESDIVVSSDSSESWSSALVVQKAPDSRQKWALYRHLTSTPYEILSSVVTLINITVLAMDHYGISDDWLLVLNWVNKMCVYFFLIEVVVKLIVLTPPHFFYDGYNVLDFCLVLLSVPETWIEPGTGSNAFTALRGFRFVRIVRSAGRHVEGLQLFLLQVQEALSHVFYLSLLSFLLILIYAVVGVQLMSCDAPEGRCDFEHIGSSALTVFIVVTGETWGEIMETAIDRVGIGAIFYFATLYILGNYVLLNLLVAILIDNFGGADFDTSGNEITSPDEEADENESGDSVPGLIPSTRSVLQLRDHSSVHSEITITDNCSDAIYKDRRQNSVRFKFTRPIELSRALVCSDSDTNPTLVLTPPKVNCNPCSGEQASPPIRQNRAKFVESDEVSKPKDTNCMITTSPNLLQTRRSTFGFGYESASSIASSSDFDQNSTNFDHNQSSCLTGRKALVPLIDGGSQGSPLGMLKPENSQTRRVALIEPVTRTSSDRSNSVRSAMKRKSSGFTLATDSLTPLPMKGSRSMSVYSFGSGRKSFQVEKTVKAVVGTSTMLNKAHTNQLPPQKVSSMEFIDFDIPRKERTETPPAHHRGPNILYQSCKAARVMVTWEYFDSVVLVLIVINIVFIAMDNPNTQDNEPELNEVVLYVDWAFVLIYALEMIAKMMAFSVVGFFNDPWNTLDAVVVGCSIVGVFVRVLRSIRSLRILRLVSSGSQEMRIALTTVVSSIPGIRNVVLISTIVWLMFAVIGVQLFKGALYACTDPATHYKVNCTGSFNPSLLTLFGTMPNAAATIEARWEPHWFTFDDVFESMFTLFQVSVGEGWKDIMYRAIDAPGVGQGPRTNANSASALFFVVFVIVGQLFFVNIFIGVLMQRFAAIRFRNQRGAFETENQYEWSLAHRTLLSVDICDDFNKTSCLSLKYPEFHKFVTSKTTEALITICVILNAIMLSVHHYDHSEGVSTVLKIGNWFFLSIFTLEAIAKISALSKYYFEDAWNRFDFLILGLSWLSVAFSSGATSGLRVLRVGRVLRLFTRAKNLHKLFATIISALPSLLNVTLLLFVVFFIFGVFGVDLFGRADAVHRWASFKNLYYALVTLYQVSTTERWNTIMFTVTEKGSGVPEGSTVGGVHIAIARAYFVLFILLGVFVFLNLFIYVMLEHFDLEEESQRIQEKGLNHRAVLQQLRSAWRLHDPKHTGFISAADCISVLQSLPEPLWLQSAWSVQNMFKGQDVSKRRSRFLCTQQQLRSCVIPLDKDLKVRYLDVLKTLSLKVFDVCIQAVTLPVFKPFQFEVEGVWSLHHHHAALFMSQSWMRHRVHLFKIKRTQVTFPSFTSAVLLQAVFANRSLNASKLQSRYWAFPPYFLSNFDVSILTGRCESPPESPHSSMFQGYEFLSDGNTDSTDDDNKVVGHYSELLSNFNTLTDEELQTYGSQYSRQSSADFAIVLPNNDLYEGDVDDDGLPHGFGIQCTTPKQFFIGHWEHGKRLGPGTESTKRTLKKGMFENDTLNDMFGICGFRQTGAVFVGSFKNGNPSGESGTLFHQSGLIISGTFIPGTYSPIGKCTYHRQQRVSGIWTSSELKFVASKGKSYARIPSCDDGEGDIVSGNGDHYTCLDDIDTNELFNCNNNTTDGYETTDKPSPTETNNSIESLNKSTTTISGSRSPLDSKLPSMSSTFFSGESPKEHRPHRRSHVSLTGNFIHIDTSGDIISGDFQHGLLLNGSRTTTVGCLSIVEKGTFRGSSPFKILHSGSLSVTCPINSNIWKAITSASCNQETSLGNSLDRRRQRKRRSRQQAAAIRLWELIGYSPTITTPQNNSNDELINITYEGSFGPSGIHNGSVITAGIGKAEHSSGGFERWLLQGEGNRVLENRTEEGHYTRHRLNGWCKITSPITTFTGRYQYGMPNGLAKIFLQSQSMREGIFRDGMIWTGSEAVEGTPNGFGRGILITGTTFEGKSTMGCPVDGIFTFPDGRTESISNIFNLVLFDNGDDLPDPVAEWLEI